MKLIVGLGNPRPKYESTKHNVGFMVVDHLLKDLEPVNKSNWSTENKLKSDIYILDYQRRSTASSKGGQAGQAKKDLVERVILAKPLTYMNNSGMAVSLVSNFYKVKPSDIWIVHDELDLPLGFMKIRFGGGVAGHHGLESILKTLGTDKFWRFRLGIGQRNSKFEIRNSKLKNVENFVLTNFHGAEKSKARALIKRGAKALSTALEKGIESAQNRFNTK
ncbi:MAG: aminoacyl-tRNA hydrolase [Candidatus Levybacteria bacterium]|nr:aminoacyl-tRNA hydrolase [Candidatus Levybacteria bacterium]